jgi:hypothetical protein
MGDPDKRGRTVLAIHSGALGDVILFGRLLSRLGGAVTLVAGREKGELLAGLGVVERCLDFDALPMHEVFCDARLEECRLPALLCGCDRLVSCFAAGDRGAELRLAALCGASSAAFLPVRPPAECSCHVVGLWEDLLGLPAGKHARPWPVPGRWRRDAGRRLAEAGVDPQRPFVVIHPGAGSKDKCWPLAGFVELAGLLGTAPAGRGLNRCCVVFVLGPVERDRWSAETVASLGRAYPLLTDLPLALLAGLLAAARAYVGNDSGVSHLAAAVGAPTLALFGPTRAEHFAPLGPAVSVLDAGEPPNASCREVLSALSKLIR